MPEDDHLKDIRSRAIDPVKLARWEAEAKHLGEYGTAVSLELADLHRDPCNHRLIRAANAARFVAKLEDEPKKGRAIALAEALEAEAVE